MRTPSLGRRFVAVGVCVVAVLVLGLDVLVYLSVRSVASDRTVALLESHTALIGAVVAPGEPPPAAHELAQRLGGLGVDATVQADGGPVLHSAVARPAAPDKRVSQEVPTVPGLRIVLFAPSPEADPDLRRLLAFQAVVTPLVVALAALLLRWVAEVAMAPLEEIAAAARRTAGGRLGERLRPDRSDTRLGQIATAYDEMVEALEGAVAEARAAQAESTRLGDRTRRILETAGEAFMVTDAAGAVVEWNAEAERLLGWPRDDVLGRNLEDTILPHDMRPAHLTSLDHFEESGGERPYRARNLATVAVHRDGGRLPVELTMWVTPHDDTHTYNALLRDLTEQKKAEEVAFRLATIVEATDRAILSTDLVGTVLTWNPGAERMYGYSPVEALGRRLADLVVPEAHLRSLESSLAAAARGEVIENAEVVRRRNGGEIIHVALTVSPLRDATGAVYGASSLERDVTDERRTASHLAASRAALEAALVAARRSEAGTRRFLDDAAHQLRSPITSIRASAETLLRNVTPAQRDKLIAAVVRDSERAGRLMAGLLRMARLGHAQALRMRPTDLVDLCQDEADQARLDSPHLEIMVAVEGPPLGPALVAAEEVAEVLANLVDNARRHARSRIDITVAREEQWVRLTVRDDGPGLPAGQSEAAFARFVSLDDKGGSGLGLAIARELARAHGGDLTYDGGAFVLALPLRPGGQPPVITGGGEADRGGRREWRAGSATAC